MSDEFKMPSGYFTFELPDGQKFEFEPLSTQEEWKRIADDCRSNPETNRQSVYLDRVGVWLEQNCGVRLNRSQVDHLIDALDIELAKKKKERRDALLSNLPSLVSTN